MMDRIRPLKAVRFDVSGLIPGAYTVINELGFDHPCNIVKIVNNSDSDLHISFDGATAHDFIATYRTLHLPLSFNSLYKSKAAKGFRIYVKGTMPKFGGWVYVIGYY